MGPGMEPAYGCLKNVFRQAVAGDAQQTGFVDRGLQRLKLAVYKRRWKEMRGAASRHAGFGHVATYVQPDEAQPLHVLTQLRAVNQFQGRATEQEIGRAACRERVGQYG